MVLGRADDECQCLLVFILNGKPKSSQAHAASDFTALPERSLQMPRVPRWALVPGGSVPVLPKLCLCEWALPSLPSISTYACSKRHLALSLRPRTSGACIWCHGKISRACIRRRTELSSSLLVGHRPSTLSGRLTPRRVAAAQCLHLPVPRLRPAPGSRLRLRNHSFPPPRPHAP